MASRRASAPFRFRDLPIEVQIQIFQLFKPAKPPTPTTEADDAPLVAWAQLKRSFKSGLYEYESPDASQARNFLLLDKSTFRDFAPHYYQSSVIRFLDPVTFANDFLGNATDACLYNLRFVSCVLVASYHYEKIEKIKNLTEMVGVWHELKHLQRFELVCAFHALGSFEYPESYAAISQNELWKIFDCEEFGGQLSKLEQRLSTTTFKGVQKGPRLQAR